eukprot:6217621-Amphidinium_carterae.3
METTCTQACCRLARATSSACTASNDSCGNCQMPVPHKLASHDWPHHTENAFLYFAVAWG